MHYSIKMLCSNLLDKGEVHMRVQSLREPFMFASRPFLPLKFNFNSKATAPGEATQAGDTAQYIASQG